MRDAGKALRIGYLEKLDGAITGITGNNGSVIPTAIPVYDSAGLPANPKYPRILLSTFISTEIGQGAKDTYGQILSQLVEVCDEVSNTYGGKQVVDDIANEVIQLIRVRTPNQVSMGPDWNVITSTLEDINTLEEQITGGVLIRKMIRFNHMVHQLTGNN